MSICKYCKEEISSKSMGVHVLNCKSNPKYEEFQEKRKLKYALRTKEYSLFKVKCYKCDVEFDVNEPILKFPLKEKYFCSRSCANYRKFKRNIKEKIKICSNCKIKFKPLKNEKYCSYACKNLAKKPMSEETRDKISAAVKGKTGGWRNFGGNGKSGIFKNIIFQSSWELAWLIYHFDIGNAPKRSTLQIEYINEVGKICKYFPDFELNNQIFEIKGYWSKKTELKLIAARDSGINIVLICKDDIKPYLEYCINKYGKNFYNAFLV